MESPSRELPGSNPIDRTSLSDAQKKSLQETVDRAQEEDLARRYSTPTKLLGWLLIGSFCLDLAGRFTGTRADLGGLLSLLAGIGILTGSQGWLRFATFVAVPVSIAGLADLLGSVVLNYPVEVGNKWLDFRDLSFWTLGVSPAMLLLAEAILAVLVFRLRRIRFWTRTVTIFAGIVGILILLQMVDEALDWHRNRAAARELPAEIQAARDLVNHHGGGSGSTSIIDWNATLDPMEKIRKVDWRLSPRLTVKLYDRESRAGGSRSDRSVRHSSEWLRFQDNLGRSFGGFRGQRVRHYSEWLHFPSGDWGKLELELIPSQDP